MNRPDRRPAQQETGYRLRNGSVDQTRNNPVAGLAGGSNDPPGLCGEQRGAGGRAKPGLPGHRVCLNFGQPAIGQEAVVGRLLLRRIGHEPLAGNPYCRHPGKIGRNCPVGKEMHGHRWRQPVHFGANLLVGSPIRPGSEPALSESGQRRLARSPRRGWQSSDILRCCHRISENNNRQTCGQIWGRAWNHGSLNVAHSAPIALTGTGSVTTNGPFCYKFHDVV